LTSLLLIISISCSTTWTFERREG